MITRQQYMASSGSLHQAYYLQFVTPTIESTVRSKVGLDRLLRSRDPYFNDIPLSLWDRVSETCRHSLAARTRELTGQATYSLSDGVCAAKACARKMCEEYAAEGNVKPWVICYWEAFDFTIADRMLAVAKAKAAANEVLPTYEDLG